MKHLLEVHVLQNFAPSNLNRDDTGSPKDAIFGGYRRGRISSQCLKRAMREYVKAHGLLDERDLASRTKRIAQVVAKYLREDFDVEEQLAQRIARTAVSSILKSELKAKGDGADLLTKVLIYLNADEAQKMAQVCHAHLDELTKLSGEAAEKARLAIEEAEEEVAKLETQVKEEEGKDEKATLKDALKGARSRLRDAKKSAGNVEIPDAIKADLKKVFETGKRSVDVALFGRMLAELPRKEPDEAACQVAHAISTNTLEREFDYYTAVDDLNPREETGAGMIGTTEFGSSCFYRYAAFDLEKFKENLGGDDELMPQGLAAFLRAMVKAKPSGKQNSFAAHNDPEYIVLSVRQNADPRNLANAFEKPVRPKRDNSLTEASIERFEQKWRRLEEAYGQSGTTFILNLTDLPSQLGEKVDSLDSLLEKALSAVKSAPAS
jgi:CRISPR system Cascade subunit CasC